MIELEIRWPDIVGAIGVTIIIVTYFLLQIDRLKSSALSYSILNGLGASLIIFSLAFQFNWSAFLVEAFWVVISVMGIIRYFRQRGSK